MSLPPEPNPGWLAFLKASTPFALGGSLLVLSSMALTMAAAPLFLLLSPVLLPAMLTAAVIFTGLIMSFAGLGASAYWVYNYTAGKKPLGAQFAGCLIWRVKKAIKVLMTTPPPRIEDVTAKVVG